MIMYMHKLNQLHDENEYTDDDEMYAMLLSTKWFQERDFTIELR